MQQEHQPGTGVPVAQVVGGAPMGMGMNGPAEVLFEGRPSCIGSPHAWFRREFWRITTNSVEVQYGVCCKTIEHLELIRVKDIAYSQQCCCCGCTTITIWSSDETSPLLKIRGLFKGQEIYKRLRDAIEAKHNRARLELQS